MYILEITVYNINLSFIRKNKACHMSITNYFAIIKLSLIKWYLKLVIYHLRFESPRNVLKRNWNHNKGKNIVNWVNKVF